MVGRGEGCVVVIETPSRTSARARARARVRSLQTAVLRASYGRDGNGRATGDIYKAASLACRRHTNRMVPRPQVRALDWTQWKDERKYDISTQYSVSVVLPRFLPSFLPSYLSTFLFFSFPSSHSPPIINPDRVNERVRQLEDVESESN